MNKAEHKKLREEIKNDPGYQKMLKEIIKLCEQIKEIKQQRKELNQKINQELIKAKKKIIR